MAKAVRADPSFRQCQWSVGDIDTLLHPIEVHVEAAASVRNRCKEALTLISREWGVDAEEYIRCQGLVEQSLKLIASIANRRDVPDLKTGLLLANTQVVRQIMEGKTFHSRRLFLTTQDSQLCKENPIPSRDLFDEKLHNAGVHLNLAGEICPDRLLLPVSGRTTTNTASTTSTPAPTSFTRPVLAPNLSPLPTPSPTSSPLPAPAPTRSTPLAPPMLSTPASTSTPTNSASTSQRPKVASVEDDEESDSELLSRGRFVGVSGVSALPISGVPACPVSEVPAIGASGVSALPVSGVPACPVSEVTALLALPHAEGLSSPELKKQQLDEWLHCRVCCGLNGLWCADVLNNLYNDLVGCLGVLGGYFYTHVYVCKTHRPWLGACCHLKTDNIDNIHDCLQTMWSNGLSHDALTAFAKNH